MSAVFLCLGKIILAVHLRYAPRRQIKRGKRGKSIKKRRNQPFGDREQYYETNGKSKTDNRYVIRSALLDMLPKSLGARIRLFRFFCHLFSIICAIAA